MAAPTGTRFRIKKESVTSSRCSSFRHEQHTSVDETAVEKSSPRPESIIG